MQRHCFLAVISVAILGTGAVCSTEVSAQTLSQNYLKVYALPRYGEPVTNLTPDLAQAVSDHNHSLDDNPAKKNRNRVVYLDGPHQYHPVEFPVTPDTPLVDGNGRVMGHVDTRHPEIQIDFGQHKTIDGQDHVIAFATRMAEGNVETGWILTSALVPSPQLTQYASVVAMNEADTSAMGDSPDQYKVVCGSADGMDGGRLKIAPRIADSVNKHDSVSDYVLRPGNVCYLLFSLPGHGGVATDILSDGATFIAAAGVPRVEVPCYLPTDATPSEIADWSTGKLQHEMEFLYGRVGNRYGWIPTADLQTMSGAAH